MLELSSLKVISDINNFVNISKETLQKQIQLDNFYHPILTLINLVKSSNWSSYTIYEIKTYLLDLIVKANITNEIEQQWILLYLIIYALDINDSKNIEYLNSEYSKLPKLSNTDFHKWLEYKMDLTILPIYNEDTRPLIEVLQSTPDEIIHLMD